MDESGIESPEAESEKNEVPSEPVEENAPPAIAPPESEKDEVSNESVEENVPPAIAPPDGQRTLFGGGV